jgi:hypothetical protein
MRSSVASASPELEPKPFALCAVCAGKINFEGVVDSDAFLNRLCEILGIGKWTALFSSQ